MWCFIDWFSVFLFRNLLLILPLLLLCSCYSEDSNWTQGLASGSGISKVDQKQVAYQKVVVNESVSNLPSWPRAQWWTKYGRANLNTLITYALKYAPSVENAQARLLSAMASIKQVNPAQKITISADGSASFAYPSKHSTDPPLPKVKWQQSYMLGLSGSYQLDIFGAAKGHLVAAVGAEKAQEAALASARLVLASSIAQTYFNMQLALHNKFQVQHSLAIAQSLYRYSRALYKQGLTTSEDLRTARLAIHNYKAQLAQLTSTVQTQKVALVALVGGQQEFITNLQMEPMPDVSISAPPALDYNLLSHRPDLKAKELLVEASLGSVAAAKAAFYPSFSLNMFAGLTSVTLGHLIDLSSQQVSIKPALSLPIFNTGMLKANLLVERSKNNQAIADYNSSVVEAVKDVITAVDSLNSVDDQAAITEDILRLNNKSLLDAQLKMKQGLGTVMEVANKELNVITTQITLTQLCFKRIISDINLIQALGGGYHVDSEDNHEPPPDKAQDASKGKRTDEVNQDADAPVIDSADEALEEQSAKDKNSDIPPLTTPLTDKKSTIMANNDHLNDNVEVVDVTAHEPNLHSSSSDLFAEGDASFNNVSSNISRSGER